MTVQLTIAEREGEQIFESLDLKFDRLHAFDEFEGGTLRVIREGDQIAETSRIGMYGTHAPATCFMGLAGLFDEQSVSAWVTSGLSARDLHIGDQIELEVDPAIEQDFAEFMQQRYYERGVLLESLPLVGETISMGELADRIDSVAEERSDEELPEILRF